MDGGRTNREPLPLSLPAKDLQFPRTGQTKCDVVIGLDFGTSGTKVVLRTPYEVDAPAFAVPFGELGHSSLCYALPTKLAILPDERFDLSVDSATCPIGRIKQRLIEATSHVVSLPCGDTVIVPGDEIAVAYLALVLRYIRRWFLVTKQATFGNRILDWHLNVGVPSAAYDDSSLVQAYQLVTKAAWHLSAKPWRINRKMAERALDDVGRPDWDDARLECELAIAPEVLAEAIGYSRSPLRDEGLHLIVDVGAWSIDVCGFILHEKEGTDRYSLLTTDVQWLGAARLHERRAEAMSEQVRAKVRTIYDSLDPLQPVPDDPSVYSPDVTDMHYAVVKAGRDLTEDCLRVVLRTIAYIKRHRDPHSERFRTALPVFLCGGAGDMEAYRAALNSASNWLREATGGRGLQVLPLLKPRELQADVSDATYHRLAVAYGLSVPSFDFGDVEKPSDIPDIAPNASHVDVERYISKDMT